MTTNPRELEQKGRLKFLLKDTVVYGGAGAIRTLFALITFPILTRYFSVEDYGVIDAFNVLATLLTVSIIFGQDSAVARFFYEYDNVLEKRNVISQSLLLQLVLLVLAIPFLLWFAEPIARFYVDREDLQNIAILVIWQVPFALLMNFSANLLKWTFQKWKYLLVQLGSSFVQVIAIIIAIFVYKIGIRDVFIIALVVKGIFGVLGLAFVRKWLIIKLNHMHYKELLKYGIPLGVLVIMYSVVPVSDRYFINRFLTPFDLGLYAAGLKIAMLIKLPINAFQTAWGPFYLSLFKEANAEETYNTVLLVFSAFVSAIGLFLGLFAKQAIIILSSDEYIEATAIVFPLLFGTIIMSFGWILSIGINLSKKSYQKFISAIIRLCGSIGIILLLIKDIGLMSIGIAFLVSYIILVLYETIVAYRLYPLRFKLRQPIFILAMAFILVLLSSLYNHSGLLIEVFINVIIFTGFCFLLWLVPLKRRNLIKLIVKQQV